MELDKYLEFAKSIAYEAGEVMRKYFLNNEVVWKSDKTPLTVADTIINDTVIDRISKEYPGHTVVGEERSLIKKGRYAWVCDPIDGTMPYSHGVPSSTFALALCYDGAPVVGVVYEPFTDRLFYASRGGGTFCNGLILQVNRKTSLRRALVDIAGFPNTVSAVVDVGGELVNSLVDRGAKVTMMWSSILPGALVASGAYTAIVLNGIGQQDGAATKVIVEEAGGMVTDLFGNEQRYDQPIQGFVASNGLVHQQILSAVKRLTKEVK